MNRLLHVPFRGLDGRLARQKAIEASVLENANRVAAARVDELRRTDPVRARVYATIPYFGILLRAKSSSSLPRPGGRLLRPRFFGIKKPLF